MHLLASLTPQQLFWLVPVFFAFRNLEEAPGKARWAANVSLPGHHSMTTAPADGCPLPGI